MALNLSYAEMSRGFAGMLADSRYKDADSFVQGEVSAEIPFGAAVAQGTKSTTNGTPDKAILMVDGNSVVVGVLMHTHEYVPTVQLGDTGVKIKNMLSVLRRGRIYMLADNVAPGSILKGQALFVRHTAGAGGTQKGAVRVDADTASAVESLGLIAAEDYQGDGIIKVDVDMVAARVAANI